MVNGGGMSKCYISAMRIVVLLKYLTMKGFLALVILSSAICAVRSDAKEKDEEEVIEKCAKDFKVSEEELEQLFKFEKVPNGENIKCMIACYMKELGFLHDGKFDVEALKESDRKDWKDPASLDKILKIDDQCAKEVGTEKNDCDLAHKFLTCVFREAHAVGIKFPTDK